MKHSLSMEESLAKYSQYDCEKIFLQLFLPCSCGTCVVKIPFFKDVHIFTLGCAASSLLQGPGYQPLFIPEVIGGSQDIKHQLQL